MTNVEALKQLYVKLGGEAADVAGVNTTLDMLNAIDTLYDGDGNAQQNAEAIENIAYSYHEPEPPAPQKYSISLKDGYNLPSGVTMNIRDFDLSDGSPLGDIIDSQYAGKTIGLELLGLASGKRVTVNSSLGSQSASWTFVNPLLNNGVQTASGMIGRVFFIVPMPDDDLKVAFTIV